MPEQLGLGGSTLPFFGVDPEACDGLHYAYHCERCSERFMVDMPLDAATAPCPHCFKVSQVPAPK